MTVSAQIIKGLDEEISEIRLAKRLDSQTKIVYLSFVRVQAVEKLHSFRNQIDRLWFCDEEGEIQVVPNGSRFYFREDGSVAKIQCYFEVESPSEFERLMQFFHRYAEAHGFQFQSK